MNKFKEVLKSIISPNNLLFFLFIILLFIKHAAISNVLVSDDIAFSQALSNDKNIIEFLSERYSTWSSRIFIEYAIVSIFQFDFLVWKLLNILIMILLVKSISKICMNDNWFLNGVIYILVLAFPIEILNNTGWVATTMNYLWVVSLGCYSISLIIDYIKNKKVSFFKMIGYALACLYATNQEQMAAVVFAVLMTFLIYELIKHKSFKMLKSRKTLIALLLITIFNLVLILFCPGNYIRKEIEVLNWFKGYDAFNTFQKLELGLTSTMRTLLLNTNIYYLVFTLIIFIGTCVASRSKISKVISVIPLLVGAAITFFEEYIKISAKAIYMCIIKFRMKTLISSVGIMTLNDILIIATYILILLIIPICIYLIFRNRTLGFTCIGIYMLGVMTRFIMGFSPTVFGSGERTFIFIYIAFIICTIFILKDILYKSSE